MFNFRMLINGVIAAAVAWGVTHSKFVALMAFGAAAGLSGNHWNWWKEISEGLKRKSNRPNAKSGGKKIESNVAGNARGQASKALGKTVTKSASTVKTEAASQRIWTAFLTQQKWLYRTIRRSTCLSKPSLPPYSPWRRFFMSGNNAGARDRRIPRRFLHRTHHRGRAHRSPAERLGSRAAASFTPPCSRAST